VGTVVLIPAPLVAVDPYLWVLISLSFPPDLQLRSIDICFSIQWSGNGAETRENFVQSVENNRRNREESWGETCEHCKTLGLPASTLNTTFAKKNEIREQIQKCGNVQEEKNWQGVYIC
jgi:hypothetical protein